MTGKRQSPWFERLGSIVFAGLSGAAFGILIPLQGDGKLFFGALFTLVGRWTWSHRNASADGRIRWLAVVIMIGAAVAVLALNRAP